ncbi:Nucleoside transporter FUN26 [Yarrowia sp. C11]|nr:Nucleoside transporter FUN26 [Yarrowia sp. E02]KAG5365137.1 Nucleoside transporter FUN26 [Yarrowia sp. C11]
MNYISAILLGAMLLWPWNAFLLATPYLRHRFLPIPSLSNNTASAVMTVSTVTSVVTNMWLQTWKKDYRDRVVMGHVIIASVFAVLAVLCVLFLWLPTAFYFCVVMVLDCLSSVGVSVAQNGSFALASERNTQGIMMGQGLAGIMPALVSLVATTAGDSVDYSSAASWSTAFSFFVATAIAGLSLFVFTRNQQTKKDLEQEPFIGEEDLTASTELRRPESPADPIPGSEPASNVPIKVLAEKLKAPAFSVIFTFVVTLSFPIFAELVEPNNSVSQAIIPIAFVVWNGGDLLGRSICAKEKFVVKGSRNLVTYALLRFCFIPAFFLCNIKGRGAVIPSDFFYLLLQFGFGVTSGHLSSSSMMAPGAYVNKSELSAAGGFMTLCLTIGLALGALASFILVAFIG